MSRAALVISTFFVVSALSHAALDFSPSAPSAKQSSTFFPPEAVARARHNCEHYDWARQARDAAVAAARPWLEMSDDELWGLMFGPRITRSWMVWSNGFCPACRKPVPMYNWVVEPLKLPWKVRCPHCGEVFPKNDFHRFYLSGLDEHRVFDPARADRSLLYNAEHPDPADPLHLFGVDDGEGYFDGEHRWRFIGAYLIYGQWKQLILGGLRNLAAAYIVTGDPVYAHKAGIILDRVADLYPAFDFATQGLVYEQRLGSNGYVSVWHDACEETRELALIYDAIFPGLQGDESLVSFLAAKAARYHLPNPKNSLADILRNIENGIFRDALRNQHKIASNFPRTPVALATIMAVLDWDGAQDSIYKLFDETFPRATAVDGVTGEKGLRNYSAFVIQGLAEMLGYFSRVDPGFIRKLLGRYPRLRETYRFHIDTWCMEAYYPHSGDTGWLGSRDLKYVGVTFDRGSPSSPDTVSQWIIRPSGYKFLWDLYKATGDADYVKVLYKANGSRTDGLPHDLFCADPVQFQKAVARVIAKHGAQVALRSVNKQQWCLAILRSGQGDHSRVVWLDYDAGGGHGHADAMNLGLFAYGLDLLPDFGYPPVQFGGWGSPRAAWYGLTAAHNTVVVNRASQQAGSGATTLWGDGQAVHVIRASAPAVYSIPQYSRSVALIDISDRDFYCADVFWVVGGGEHIKFVQGPPGKVSTRRLDLKPAEDLGSGTILRDLQLDPSAPAGWQADFSVEDIHSYLPPGRKVKMRYHDLTGDAAAGVCQAWAAVSFESTEELWLPRLVVQRRGQVPLASTFVGVFQPYLSRPPIVAVRRLPVEARSGVPYGQSVVAVECTLTDGRRDLLIFADSENPLGSQPDFRELRNLRQPDWQLSTDAEFCFVRLDAKGRVERAAIAKGTRLRAGSAVLHLKRPADFIEVVFLPAPRVVSGDPDIVASVGTIAAGAVKKPMRTLTVRAYYYQHFDADFSRDVPAEGYGGWKEAEIDLSLDHTAVALMHVWDTGTREEYPGWHRAVEYIPRAEQICRTVLPRLLKAVREAKFPLVHIVGGGNYYQDLPGYREVVQLAGPPPPPPEQVEADEVLQRLRAFRASRVFPGAHNQPDIDRGFARIDFHPVAKPLPQEPVVENAHQLFAWCRAKGINHLIYAGFAVNWCLLMSPGGMIDMSRHGLMCSVFRDATTAVENRESARAELNKQEALWRVALAFGFVFDTEDFIAALRSQAQ